MAFKLKLAFPQWFIIFGMSVSNVVDSYTLQVVDVVMVNLVHCSGLNNDHISETFPLRHTIDGNSFPCRYIRIGELLQLHLLLIVILILIFVF